MHAFLISAFGYKAWANVQLLETLQFNADRLGGRLTPCLRILNHAYVVDQIFRAHLNGMAPAYVDTNTPETPSLRALQRHVTQTDDWFNRYVQSLPPVALSEEISFQFTDGDSGRMTRAEILWHLINHGTYHRGNAGQMLKDAGIAPPRDVFSGYLHAVQPERRDLSR